MTFSSSHRHTLLSVAEHVLGPVGVVAIALLVALNTPSLGEDTRLTSDRLRPSEPVIHLAQVLPNAISLYWDGAKDDVGVVGYRIYRNGTLLADQSLPSFTDGVGLVPGSIVAYTVAAVDASGNLSEPSQATFVVVPSASSSPEDATVQEVFFSVTPAPIFDCQGGMPVHEVFFALSDVAGGSFLLTSPTNGVSDAQVEWGRQYLPNGTYIWEAQPSDGYTAGGLSAGEFVLSGNCAIGSTATGVQTPTTSTSSTLTSGAEATLPAHPAEVRPALRLFVESMPVSPVDYRFSNEQVELRVTAIKAKKVNYYALREGIATPLDLGVGAYDDLLSLKGTDVWVMTWDTADAPSGEYQVLARALLLTGSVSETLPVSVRISHTETLSSSREGEKGHSVPAVQAENDISLREELLPEGDLVLDPSRCTDTWSCRAYCTEGESERDRCFVFAQTELASGTSTRFSSLVDGVSAERITALLSDFIRRPKDLPEYVLDTDDLTVFCRDLGHADLCARILDRGNLLSEETIAARRVALSSEVEAIESVFDERIGVRAYVDTDGDHVSDYDEINVYGTDPNEQDSDGDGFLDGEEIIVHTDPLGGAPRTPSADPDALSRDQSTPEKLSEEVHMEDARMAGIVLSERLSIRRVTSIELGSEGTTTRKMLKFSGTALPNSYVTLSVFSDPIMVTTRANASGTWSYMLPQNLPDGAHTAILSIFNADGKVLVKSDPLLFVKEGSAVTLASAIAPSVEDDAPAGGTFAFIALLLAFLGVGLSVAGFFYHHRHLHTPRIVLGKGR